MQPLHLAPGTVIGADFRLIEPLAEGGMGAVYIADQLSTGNRRALKVMLPHLVRSDALRKRFEQEARVGALIQSDHVVQVVAAGVDGPTGMPYLAMELLDGQSLASLLEGRGPLPPNEVWAVLSQLCHALGAAHAAGVVHRDLKPENIFLAVARREGIPFTVKVLDFGIAKMIADADTAATAAVGTPLWMAPEQAEHGGVVHPATDVWALGLLAFRLLTGRLYWRSADNDAPSPSLLLREVVIDPLVPASERASALGCAERLPPGFDEWFARCVAREVGARFPNATEARAALASLLGGDTRDSSLPPISLSTAVLRPASRPAVAASLAFQVTAAGPSALLAAVARSAPATSPSPPEPHAEPHDDPTPAAPRSPWPLVLLGLGALGGLGAVAAVATGGRTTQPSAVTSASGAAPPPCPGGMIRVEGGPVQLRPDERVDVRPLCVDRTEVTVEAYTRCATEGRCVPAPTAVDWPSISDDERKKWSAFCNGAHPERLNHPINCVSAPQASGYCIAQGKRLPAEAELVWLAAGREERLYPWGSGAADERACWSGVTDRLGSAAGTCPVGLHAAGASPQGLVDLAGNVAEWSVRGGDALKTSTHGGSWSDDNDKPLRSASRERRDPLSRSSNVGFRCVFDPAF